MLLRLGTPELTCVSLRLESLHISYVSIAENLKKERVTAHMTAGTAEYSLLEPQAGSSENTLTMVRGL